MTYVVSARDANQQFSDILGRAAQGESVVITKRGEPVAQLIKYGSQASADGAGALWGNLIAELESGVSLGGDRFQRGALYDR